MDRRMTLWWFLFGLGAQLQIVASLSFSEAFALCAAPLLVFKEWTFIKRDGLGTLFVLALCLFANGAISCIANHSPMMFVVRGMAVLSLIVCSIVVGHWLLRRDLGGFKWYLVGDMLSNILCTFVFQRSADVAAFTGDTSGVVDVATMMSGPLFWISKVKSVAMLPVQGWYLQCPMVFCVGVPLGLAVFSLLISTSGRAAMLGFVGAAFLAFIGGKKATTIKSHICNKFWLLMAVAIIGVFTVKEIYRISASAGWLGEGSRAKYERQTKGDGSLISLVMGGRMESFCGLIACVDKPIIGFGPWAIDNGGYTEEFISKYADGEDYQKFIELELAKQRYGITGWSLIPCHSYIVEFWLWYGIFGLIFWLYVLYVLLRYIKEDCYAVPHMFMWLACGIPMYLWNIFFSPFGNRTGTILFIVAVLMVRAVRKGLLPLASQMLTEVNGRYYACRKG
jgi:hypothetical protein